MTLTSPSTKPFGSLLVANRGEIACRIVRAATAAGIRTVAVWSDADRDAPHVRAADDDVRLGGTPAAESYLSVDALLRACRVSGAEAVHPGYGFLSEQAAFARAVTEAGMVFVGPSPAVMEVMGRKDRARDVAVSAGVPVIPSFEAATATEPEGTDVLMPGAKAAQHSVPYPVLVKAAAGGGGKGMRVVRSAGALPAAIAAARREAAAAFGDDTLLLERYVEHGRHVEVQVLADAHGTCLHLYERDCSVQRRHQKVLEEAPAPTVSAGLRARLCAAAVAIAQRVGYVNAGTVEFLVAGDEFFFLEMNTRLQVEHAVTEAVTGLDLVRLQLDVAAGRPLGLAQEQVALAGHAIEARVYAEDPYSGFLPQAGRASAVHWPRAGRARVDAALDAGHEVSTAYDPLLGKVITHGATREAARLRLVAALDETAIVGLTTNVGFLRDLVASDAYADAAIDTGWLDDDPAAAAATTAPEPPEQVWQRAARAVLAERAVSDPDDPFGAGDGWRVGGPPAPAQVALSSRGQTRVVRVPPAPRGDDLVHPGGDGASWIDGHRVSVAHHGHVFVLDRPDAFAPDVTPAVGDSDVVSPMPGTVLAVHVVVGDAVEAGESLGVLEAMKMEIPLPAPLAGTVALVDVAPGSRVPIGQLMFRIDPAGGPDPGGTR
jgi:acetyl/propionyl-CoA carboxylase alpha subunit